MADRDDDVPKLPRGRGFTLSWPHVIRIAMTATVLVGVIVLQKPCADATSKFVTSFGDGSGSGAGSGSAAAPAPLDPTQYEHITPGMSDAEVRAVIERAKAKAAAMPDAGPTPGH